MNQHFLGKSTLQTGNEFLRWKLRATHNLSYGFMFKQKGIFYVIFMTRNTAFRLGSKGNKLLKKNARLQSHDPNAKTRCFKTQKLSLALRLKEKTTLPFWVNRSADNSLASFL